MSVVSSLATFLLEALIVLAIICVFFAIACVIAIGVAFIKTLLESR